MTILNQKKSLILIIDVQDKLLNAVFNKETLAKNSEIIAKSAKILNIPVIVTEQYPNGLGSTIKKITDSLPEDVRIFEKNTFSALDNSDVFDALEQAKCKQVVIFGIETHICVNQTVNTLIELGYEVSVIANASGSRDENEHNAGLKRMESNGASIITTEIALFEWLRSSKHPNFKEIQALIK